MRLFDFGRPTFRCVTGLLLGAMVLLGAFPFKAKADDVPWSFQKRMDNVEKRVTALEKQVASLRAANRRLRDAQGRLGVLECSGVGCSCGYYGGGSGACGCPTNCTLPGCPGHQQITPYQQLGNTAKYQNPDDGSVTPYWTNSHYPWPAAQTAQELQVTPWMDIGPGEWQLGTTPFVAPLIPVGGASIYTQPGAAVMMGGNCAGGNCAGGNCTSSSSRPRLLGRLFGR